MTPAETAAYRRGVADVIALARRSADALEAGTRRPLAVGFGVEALRALADEACTLIQTPANRTGTGQTKTEPEGEH